MLYSRAAGFLFNLAKKRLIRLSLTSCVGLNQGESEYLSNNDPNSSPIPNFCPVPSPTPIMRYNRLPGSTSSGSMKIRKMTRKKPMDLANMWEISLVNKPNLVKI